MLIKAKRIDNLERKVSEYKNKVVVRYLNSKGYFCNTSKESMRNVNTILKSKNQKVMLNIENEKVAQIGSYYTWEAYVRVKILDTITRNEV